MKESKMLETVQALRVTCDNPNCDATALVPLDDAGKAEPPPGWFTGTVTTDYGSGPIEAQWTACGTQHMRKAIIEALNEDPDAD